MYDIHQHKHRYAVWTASRAWNRKLKTGDLALAQRLIGVAGLESVRDPDDLGEDVDTWLLERMRLIVDYAAQHQILGINYGRAQKLVNIYLKTKLVCGGQETHPKVAKLHPPLDRKLFAGLHAEFRTQKRTDAAMAFAAAQKACSAWTNFELQDYLAHIQAIKLFMAGKPLWMVEEYWR
ncbi:hypothetical protein [Pseudomonas oryzihabitans]|uniref:hypothetical protein n=1 Tax=Pseudomonas oryzihabitans TaxID=47885 RepID=UPI0011A68758|nr:hypothetical protein [Pseudomonas oryzihabitans]